LGFLACDPSEDVFLIFSATVAPAGGAAFQKMRRPWTHPSPSSICSISPATASLPPMRAEKFKEELIKLSLWELKDQDIVAESEAMQQVLRVAFKLSKLEASNILLLGSRGQARGFWQSSSTTAAFAGKSLSSKSTAPLYRRRCSKPSFSATRGALSPARENRARPAYRTGLHFAYSSIF